MKECTPRGFDHHFALRSRSPSKAGAEEAQKATSPRSPIFAAAPISVRAPSSDREPFRQERRVEPLCAREPSGEFGQLACSLLALQCPLSTWSGAHVLRGSSGPLVKPYVGFSPVRLTDDLPRVLISNRCR